jgi:hypothetical protein
MRSIPFGCAIACVAISSVAGTATAKPLEREHYSFSESDTFIETECGDPLSIDYTGEFSGLFMLREGRGDNPTPYLFDNYEGVETYTNSEDPSKTATVIHQGVYQDLRIELISGTVYEFTALEAGRPIVVYGPDGSRLVMDRGRIESGFVVDTKGDTDLSNDVFLEFLGASVSGPHPVYDGEAEFCDLVDLLR